MCNFAIEWLEGRRNWLRQMYLNSKRRKALWWAVISMGISHNLFLSAVYSMIWQTHLLFDCGFGFERPGYSVVKACEHTILCVGGATSIDRMLRMTAKRYHLQNPNEPFTPNVYWADESPVYDDSKLDAIDEICAIKTGIMVISIRRGMQKLRALNIICSTAWSWGRFTNVVIVQRYLLFFVPIRIIIVDLPHIIRKTPAWGFTVVENNIYPFLELAL